MAARQQFKFRDGLTEYLVTVWEDGTPHLALRSVVAGTWSPPVVGYEVPVAGDAA